MGNEYDKRIDELTKIIGEQTLVINELKKTSAGKRSIRCSLISVGPVSIFIFQFVNYTL